MSNWCDWEQRRCQKRLLIDCQVFFTRYVKKYSVLFICCCWFKYLFIYFCRLYWSVWICFDSINLLFVCFCCFCYCCCWYWFISAFSTFLDDITSENEDDSPQLNTQGVLESIDELDIDTGWQYFHFRFIFASAKVAINDTCSLFFSPLLIFAGNNSVDSGHGSSSRLSFSTLDEIDVPSSISSSKRDTTFLLFKTNF